MNVEKLEDKEFLSASKFCYLHSKERIFGRVEVVGMVTSIEKMLLVAGKKVAFKRYTAPDDRTCKKIE